MCECIGGFENLKNVRIEVEKLISLGKLPSEDNATTQQLQEIDAALKAIVLPISNQEAAALVTIFGDDGCFGIAYSLVHLIETAPGWPLRLCLNNSENRWMVELRDRAIRGGFTL